MVKPLTQTLRSLARIPSRLVPVILQVRAPEETADGRLRPPLALFGDQRIPVVGLYHRLKAIITAPTQMVLDYKKDHGDLFTIRVPFKFDLTYLLSKEGHAFIMGLPPDRAQIGDVFLNVPCVGSAFPRSDFSAAHVQRLVLCARAFMANEILTKERIAGVREVVAETADEHLARWGTSVDLSVDLVSMIFDASGRACVGRDLWDRIGPEAKPLLRSIVDGIDIPRATINALPLRYFGKEYHAARKLHRLLDSVIREHERTGAYPLIDRVAAQRLGDGRIVPREDLPWMLMYILWNAMAYPGSYGLWALVDMLRHERALPYAATLLPAERRKFYTDCFHETARLSPVASVIRMIEKPLEFQQDGRTYTVDAGGFVGVFPYGICRHPDDYASPDTYDPFRYGRGEKAPPIYGRGVFGCPARQYMRAFSGHLFEELFARVSLRLVGPVEERRCRVHLTYPEGSIYATVHAPVARRTRASMAPAAAS